MCCPACGPCFKMIYVELRFVTCPHRLALQNKRSIVFFKTVVVTSHRSFLACALSQSPNVCACHPMQGRLAFPKSMESWNLVHFSMCTLDENVAWSILRPHSPWLHRSHLHKAKMASSATSQKYPLSGVHRLIAPVGAAAAMSFRISALLSMVRSSQARSLASGTKFPSRLALHLGQGPPAHVQDDQVP